MPAGDPRTRSSRITLIAPLWIMLYFVIAGLAQVHGRAAFWIFAVGVTFGGLNLLALMVDAVLYVRRRQR